MVQARTRFLPSAFARYSAWSAAAKRSSTDSTPKPGNVATPLTIRTSEMTRSVATQRAAGAVPQVVARFALDDRLLDAMAFTRGRFTVEQPGATPLVLPPWAEVGRVIEDCRS